MENANSLVVDDNQNQEKCPISERLSVSFLAPEKDSIMSSSQHMSDDDSDSDDESAKPKIPDGGWGWCVVLASFIISMIADGISFSFGLLYVEFLTEFGASKSVTSWIGSLFMAIPLLSGPIMSSLVDKYGCRTMTILGGLISAIGFVLSSYARSVYVMYLTFGVIAGLGLGMNYVTAVVSIAYWFEKRRNLAMGLGACGTGVGTFIYAPMTRYFINEYAWRGTTMLLAGTFLQMCVCGCLMRNPAWMEEQKSSAKVKTKKNASVAGSISGTSTVKEMEECKKMLTSATRPVSVLVPNTQAQSATAPVHSIRSDLDLPTFIKHNEHVPVEVLEQLSTNKNLYNLILENYPNLLESRSTSDKGLNIIKDMTLNQRTPLRLSVKLKKNRAHMLVHQVSLPEEKIHTVIKMRRSNSYNLASIKRKPPAGYLKNVRFHRNSVTYRGAMLNIRKYKLRASSCPDIYRNSMMTLAHEEETWYDEWVELIKQMFDFSYFSELHFLLFSLSTILLFTWFIVPYFYLADFMLEKGFNDDDVSMVLSVIGITNTIGMVSLGWAGDQPWMNVKKVFTACLVLCGITCFGMFALSFNFYLLLCSAALFGVFFASTFSFTPVVLAELVPLEKFTTAYGLILLCQGIGNMCGPPISGMLFDLTGSWFQAFFQAGIWIVMSGVLLGIILVTKDRKISF